MASLTPNFAEGYNRLENDITDVKRLSFIARELWDKFSNDVNKPEPGNPNCRIVKFTVDELDALGWIMSEVEFRSDRLDKEYHAYWRSISDALRATV